jgi:hypothetical protein
MAMLRVPLLVCGSVLALIGAYDWFAHEGSPQLFLLVGLGMVVVALVYKWMILDA